MSAQDPTSTPRRDTDSSCGRESLFGALLAAVAERRSYDAPFVIGINGVSAAGKTTFTAELANRFSAAGHAVQTIAVDDFHHPKSYRYATGNNGRAFYERYINFECLVRDLLQPIKATNRLHTTLTLLDLATDVYDAVRTFDVEPASVVLVEGIFLFRSDLLPFLDLTIYLDIPLSLSVARGTQRWSHLAPEDVERRFRQKYLPGHELYVARHDPRDKADIVIDNASPASPIVRRWLNAAPACGPPHGAS